MRKAWDTVLKTRAKQTQARNSELRDRVRATMDTDTHRMTANTLIYEIVIAFYACHSDMQLYRPTSVVEMGAITIDMIRNNHSSKERILKMVLHRI